MELRVRTKPLERFPKSSVAPRTRVKEPLQARITVSTGVEQKLKCCGYFCYVDHGDYEQLQNW